MSKKTWPKARQEAACNYATWLEETPELKADGVQRFQELVGYFGGQYAEVLEYFKIYQVLSNVAPNCFGYAIDPSDPLRVWL
jgi:hypothetical protein